MPTNTKNLNHLSAFALATNDSFKRAHLLAHLAGALAFKSVQSAGFDFFFLAGCIVRANNLERVYMQKRPRA